jgi:hypothetical protein
MKKPALKLASIPSAISAGLATIALLIVFLGLKDAEIVERILRVDLGPGGTTTLAIPAVAQALRLLCALVIALIVLACVLFFARKDDEPAKLEEGAKSATGPKLIEQSEALKMLVKHLENDGAVEMQIWGLSLHWAMPIYRYLREHRHRNLTIDLFVAGPVTWNLGQIDFGSASKHALKSRLDAAVHEWLQLMTDQQVRQIRVHEAPHLSNDKGVRVDNSLMLLGTYDYDLTSDGLLLFSPNRVEDRVFIVCGMSDDPYDQYLMRWGKARIACRRMDAKEIARR